MDITDWSFIDEYFGLCEAYAFKYEQINNGQKAQEIKNKIKDMKAYFQFEQLGENFRRFFEEKAEKKINIFMKLYSDLKGSVKEIFDLFESNTL